MVLWLKHGDVKFGNSNSPDFNLSLAGTGGSDLPNLKAEFTDIAHERGVVSAARSTDPNSANSQFVCFDSALTWTDNIQLLEKLLKEWNLLIKKRGDQALEQFKILTKIIW